MTNNHRLENATIILTICLQIVHYCNIKQFDLCVCVFLIHVQVLAEKTGVEQWVCMNITQLLREENTIPFMVRYRKELINHMDADAVRDVQLVLEELW